MRVSPVVALTAVIAVFFARADSLHAAPPSGVMAATVTPSAQWIIHEVIPGERIADVADRFAVSVASIQRWNNIDSKRVLSDYTGVRLRVQTHLPGRQRDKLSYVVRDGDSWSRIAHRYDVDQNTLESTWNREVRMLHPGDRLLIWVEPGVIPKEEPPEITAADLMVPVANGAVSFGWPNGGRLLNGVMIPENPALYTVRNILHSYGSTHAIQTLQRALAAFRLKTKYDGEVLLWDMSVKRGGRFGPHHSHRSGRDVDIAIPVRPGYPPETPASDDAVDWHATWSLIKSFIDTGEVKYVFLSRQRQAALYKAAVASGATPEQLEEWIQYPRTTKYGIVRHSSGHHCHLHVRFACGPDEFECFE
ncbi:MAG TPA: penicillin-insensitive murein endopeptidase [Polyangiales bacterium]|nr:penicillin-insensitive murein endopeptidase [Polyangiales bacterium]